MCDEVSRDVSPSLTGVNDNGEKTTRALQALFERVCAHLDLDPAQQSASLENDVGFRLVQTVEEHMQPEFVYTAVLDEHLLTRL